MRSSFSLRTIVLALAAALLHACSSPPPPPSQPPAGSGDTQFEAVAHEYLEDLYRRQPTQATYLGIHKYDDRLDDYSRQAVTDAVASARQFRDRTAAIDAASLSAEGSSIASSCCTPSIPACSRSTSSGRGRKTLTRTAAG